MLSYNRFGNTNQGFTQYTQLPFTMTRSFVMMTKTKADDGPLILDTSNAATSAPVEADAAVASHLELEQKVIITDSCWKRIHQLVAAKREDNLYLRVFVDAGGCSGFTYQFELDLNANLDPDEDVIFYEPTLDAHTSTPARVVVDKGSLKLIAGSKIDYVQEMIKSSFEVRENPQSESACGCGSSFAVKNFSSNPAMD